MVKIEKRCNCCGNTLNDMDEELDFGFDMILPYGSENDMAHLRLDLCISCFDRLMSEWVTPNCIINPLVEVWDEEEVPWEEFME